MMRWLCALALVVLPVAMQAQEVASANAGDIRVLDKLNGEVVDLTLAVDQPQKVGLLLITLNDCRYPARNPAGDAYAALTVNYQNEQIPVFDGWMIASSPALNAMDHPRYDVWVLRCQS